MAEAGTIKAWKRKQVRQLMKQAEKFLEDEGEDTIQLNYITRDKPRKYFREIFKGDGIMRKYIKDGHGNPQKPYGNPQNPINGGLEGLFFSAIIDWSTREPFDSSVYGPRRLQLPVDELLTTDKNLYFSDFYCMESGTSERHNITLVLCEDGSEADMFCRSHLVLLDMMQNPFLNAGEVDDQFFDDQFFDIEESGTWKVTKGAYVEVFYTEDLDISPYSEYMTDVEELYKCRNPNPQKNTKCEYCNLKKRC